MAWFNRSDEWDRKVVELERDRVQGTAKGIGRAAAGFLASLLTALFNDEIQLQVSAWTLIGCIAGAIGALALAAMLRTSSWRFVADPTGSS